MLQEALLRISKETKVTTIVNDACFSRSTDLPSRYVMQGVILL